MKKQKKQRLHLKSALIGQFVIVRTYSAGVHAGILAAKKEKRSVFLRVSAFGLGPNRKLTRALYPLSVNMGSAPIQKLETWFPLLS